MRKKDTFIQLYNESKKLKLVDEVTVASHWWTRTKGLLGVRTFTNKALIIEQCQQVHTLFMKFSIDLLYIDRKNEVIAKEIDIKPWAICKKQVNANMVIEAEAGTFTDDKVQIGDVLSIKRVDEHE